MKSNAVARFKICLALFLAFIPALVIDYMPLSALLTFSVMLIVATLIKIQYGVLFLVICFVSYVLFHFGFYDEPLSSIDADKFYDQAFGAGYYANTLIDMLRQGYVPIVHTYSELLVFFSKLLSTQSPYIITLLNIPFQFFASVIIASTTKHYLSLSSKEEIIFFLFIFLSPSLLDNVGLMQKDSFTFFITAFSSMIFAFSLSNRSGALFIFAVASLILATLLRPYSLIFLISYLFAWGVISTRVVTSCSVMIAAVGFYWQGFLFVKTSFLTFLAIFGTPNFSRLDNWESFPLMTFESLSFSLFMLPLGLAMVSDRQIKRLMYSIFLSSLVIALVTVNRLISDQSYDPSSDILADDISRKKIQVVPLVYLMFLIALRKYYMIVSSSNGRQLKNR